MGKSFCCGRNCFLAADWESFPPNTFCCTKLNSKCTEMAKTARMDTVVAYGTVVVVVGHTCRLP